MTDYQVMPPLSAEEYAALRADIRERGILVPVVRDQHGNLLDGHHRVQIAEELGIDYPHEVRQVDGHEQARDIAYALNLARRHLNRQQRRDLIAKEIEDRPDDSDRAIGRRFGCDHKTVGSVRRELRGEIPHPEPEPMTREEAERTTERARNLLNQADRDILTGLMGGASALAIAKDYCVQWGRFESEHAGDREFLDPVWKHIYQPRLEALLGWPDQGIYAEEARAILAEMDTDASADGGGR